MILSPPTIADFLSITPAHIHIDVVRYQVDSPNQDSMFLNRMMLGGFG